MANDKHPYAPDDVQTPAEQAAAQQANNAADPSNPQPETVNYTTAQLKKLCCDKLNKIFTTELMNERLMRMAGGDASRVAKNLTAFLTLISQHDGGSASNRKYYHQCSITSLVTCFLESMNMQLPFDSRNLVSIVIYDWEAELDISYKGFVNALNRHYRDAFVDTKIIMEGDEFTCEEEPEKVTYKHKAKNPFAEVNAKMDGVRGCYCYFAYTLADGRRVQRIIHVPKADLLLMRSKAKSKNVWDEWTSQQIIKSTIRRASKIPFAAIDLDVDIEEVANRHYLLDKPDGDDKLRLLMAAQEEVVNGGNNTTENNVVAGASGQPANGAGTAEVSQQAKDVGVSAAESKPAENAVNASEPAQGEAKPAEPEEARKEVALEAQTVAKAAISDADFEETK